MTNMFEKLLDNTVRIHACRFNTGCQRIAELSDAPMRRIYIWVAGNEWYIDPLDWKDRGHFYYWIKLKQNAERAGK